MSALILKCIACLTMLMDHIGYHTGIDWLRMVGRIALPIFVYLTASGYRKTSDPFRYILRLLAFALISEPIYDYCFFSTSYNGAQNIMFTLAMGLMAIMFVDKLRGKKYAFLLIPIPVGFIMYLADLMHADYGMYGVLLAVLFYLFDPISEEARGRKPFFIAMTVIAGILFAGRFILLDYSTQALKALGESASISFLSGIKLKPVSSWGKTQLWAIAALPFILLYNGEPGPAQAVSVFILSFLSPAPADHCTYRETLKNLSYLFVHKPHPRGGNTAAGVRFMFIVIWYLLYYSPRFT